MSVITQHELRRNLAEILRRAEAGERFTVTVAGRSVAELGPADAQPWVTGPDRAVPREQRRRELKRITDRSAARPSRDHRTAEDILGYGPDGLPA
jgi:prevent-host-death family protein